MCISQTLRAGEVKAGRQFRGQPVGGAAAEEDKKDDQRELYESQISSSVSGHCRLVLFLFALQ